MFYNIFVCGDTTVRTEAQDIKTSVRGDGCVGPVHRPVSGVKESPGRRGHGLGLLACSLLTILDTLGVSLLDTYKVDTVQFSPVQQKSVHCSTVTS